MIHPIIGLQVAQVLASVFHLSPKEATEASRAVISLCQRNGLDIIREEWKDKPARGFDWDDLARQVQEMEDSGRTPWNSPELR